MLAVEGDVGAHLAVVLEIDLARIENAHRLLDRGARSPTGWPKLE